MGKDPQKNGGLPRAVERNVMTIERVMSVLGNIRPIDWSDAAKAKSARLAELGFTSVDMVKVMLSIESEFGIVIPQTEITPENFLSADSIAAMMARLPADE
jgi:acyl carrier protein